MAELHLWRHARSLGRSSLDFLRLVDEKIREDKIDLLAGGVAFNLLLAIVPLLLLIITGIARLLARSQDQAIDQVIGAMSELLPASADTEGYLRSAIAAILRSGTAVLSIGTISFIWFSTRLFGSLRLVVADVFDIEDNYNIITGKLFDLMMSLIATLFVVAYFVITAYLAVGTSTAAEVLQGLGMRRSLMGDFEYWAGRAIAFSFILLTLFLLYRYLPRQRTKVRTAFVAALFTGVMFETAKFIFSVIAPAFNPNSVYSGAIAAVVVALFWVYYVALIFVLGGEVGQVYDLMRARKIQKVVFE